MKNLSELKAAMPDFANDIKANLDKFVTKDSKILTPKQVFGSALAASYATKDETLIKVMENESKEHLTDADFNAAKTAATIMALNNSYYCFTHLADDKEYLEMPTGLTIHNAKEHGIDQIDFEMFSLAVSVINSSSMCIDSHESKLFCDGFRRPAIQMVAQIASVISAVSQVLAIQS